MAIVASRPKHGIDALRNVGRASASKPARRRRSGRCGQSIGGRGRDRSVEGQEGQPGSMRRADRSSRGRNQRADGALGWNGDSRCAGVEVWCAIGGTAAAATVSTVTWPHPAGGLPSTERSVLGGLPTVSSFPSLSVLTGCSTTWRRAGRSPAAQSRENGTRRGPGVAGQRYDWEGSGLMKTPKVAVIGVSTRRLPRRGWRTWTGARLDVYG